MSQLRQRLRQAGQEYQRQLERLYSERGPLIRGSFGTRARECGKPNCRCKQGELHESKYLSASAEGTVRQVHVPKGDEVDVEFGAFRYRRFQEARRELGEFVDSHRELIDELFRELLEPYPPDDPLPPPQRRGRKPKRGRASRR